MKLVTGTWNELQVSATALRTMVFVREQGVPQELEWDAEDHSALHAVVLDNRGHALATGRLLHHAPGVARIGRMAVAPEWRGQGLGRQVLHALMQAAIDRGDRRVILHAQTSAQGFYAQAGFQPHGTLFAEAGIEHIEMWADLPQRSSRKG